MEYNEDWQLYLGLFLKKWKGSPIVLGSYHKYLFDHVLKQIYRQFEGFWCFSFSLSQIYNSLNFMKLVQNLLFLFIIFLILRKHLYSVMDVYCSWSCRVIFFIKFFQPNIDHFQLFFLEKLSHQYQECCIFLWILKRQLGQVCIF